MLQQGHLKQIYKVEGFGKEKFHLSPPHTQRDPFTYM